MTIYDFISFCAGNQINVCDEGKLMKAISAYANLLEREYIIKKNHSTDEIEILDAPALIDFLFEVHAGWYLFSFMKKDTATARTHYHHRNKNKRLLILH